MYAHTEVITAGFCFSSRWLVTSILVLDTLYGLTLFDFHLFPKLFFQLCSSLADGRG